MIKKSLYGMFVLFACFLFSGCVFAPKHEISTFDLGTPQATSLPGVNINVTPFMNSSNSNFKCYIDLMIMK